MLAQSFSKAYGGILSILLGTDCEVRATAPPLSLPSAIASVATAKLSSLSVLAEDAGGVAPFGSASISGNDVQLGWKIPALLLIPVWLLLAPGLLPVLTAFWFLGPKGPTKGCLDFDLLLRSSDLNRRRNVWRWILSAVLNGIAASSLPGLLASINLAAASGQPAGAAGGLQIPPSECLSAAVEGGKLVLDGRVRFATEVGGPRTEADYTLRMGVAPQRANTPGVLRADGRPMLRSALLWDNPEIKISLGEEGLARLLPKLWMPVMAATAVEMPPCVELTRASASDAAGGLVVQGVINLEPATLDRGWPPPTTGGGGSGGGGGGGGGNGDGGGGGRNGRWTEEERAALRLPPSR